MFKGWPWRDYLQTGFLGRSFGWTFPNIIFCACLAEPRQRARCFLVFSEWHEFRAVFFSGSPLFSPKFACDTILATFNFGHIFLPPVSGHLFTYVHRFFTPPPLSREDVAPHGNSRHSRLEIPLFHYVDRTKEKPARWWSSWKSAGSSVDFF